MKARLSRRQFLTYVSLPALGTAVLAACGAAPASTAVPTPAATTAPAGSTAASTIGSTTTVPTTVSPTATAVSGQAPNRGATITIAAANDIETGDPHLNQSIVCSNAIRHNVFNSLVRYGPNLQHVPDAVVNPRLRARFGE